MIKLLEAFDHEQGSRSRAILPNRCSATSLRGHRFHLPGTVTAHLPGGRVGPDPDPRRVRGRRYRLGSLLALCMVAVLGGATSLAAIARFAAATDSDLRGQLGLTSSTSNASTLGRFLARLDGDALDDAVGAWLVRYAADPVDEPGDTLVGLAVGGKTVRGSRTDGAAVHLLAAALHACQTVIAQRQIAANAGDSRSNADINTIGRPATARRSSISEPRRPRARPGPARPIAHTRGVWHAQLRLVVSHPPGRGGTVTPPLPCCEP
ncbi:transposase family protein [Streptomyces mirabilis]|uniref:transposase family protein n=1 Tax=Streptomyces mirabilis TaxID=68239 RepID=UPI00369DAC6F